MHKRTIACAITPEVRQRVEERDGGLCIFCHRPGRGEAHYIGRAQGGLGTEQNILTVCRPCHDRLDNSQARELMKRVAEQYLRSHYPDWDPEQLIYHKQP
jgi:5-methylcytosine-specific restriction endonuclease McrA